MTGQDITSPCHRNLCRSSQNVYCDTASDCVTTHKSHIVDTRTTNTVPMPFYSEHAFSKMETPLDTDMGFAGYHPNLVCVYVSRQTHPAKKSDPHFFDLSAEVVSPCNGTNLQTLHMNSDGRNGHNPYWLAIFNNESLAFSCLEQIPLIGIQSASHNQTSNAPLETETEPRLFCCIPKAENPVKPDLRLADHAPTINKRLPVLKPMSGHKKRKDEISSTPKRDSRWYHC